MARRPKLDGLKGTSTISSAIRDALNIPDGVLIAHFKEFSNVKRLIDDYLQNQVGPIEKDARIVHDIVTVALGDISKLVIKKVKNSRKENPTKMVMINGDCIFVSQALMLASYCKKVKLYLENTQIKNMFALEYSKAIRIKRREEEIQEANANLKHKGQMLMYTAADCGYDEINANLERDKGKRKAATANEEEDSEDKGSVGQENLDNEDEDDRGNEKRLRQETPSDTEEYHDVSFLTTTSGGTYQNSVSSNSSPYIAYVTSLDEIKPMTLENLGEVRYMSKSEPMIDRLMYSGIDFVDACEDRQYTPGILDDNIHSFVDQFVRAVRYKDGNLLLSPLKPELVNITILLLSCHFNILKEYRIQQLNFQSYRPVENQDNRETDYKIKYVVPFINSVFHVNDRFQIYWDVPFDFYDCSNMSIQRRQTSDAKFVEIGGLEIGAVEIKSFHTAAVDIDNDIVRLGEITKRMLHRRVMKAKSPREFMTFGVMVYGSIVEYYIHQYHPSQSSTAAARSSSSYTFKLIQRCTLPTLSNTYTHMMLSLEYLIYYKKLMEDSLARDSDIDEPYLYSTIDNGFIPTVTLLNLDKVFK
ncbi:hypothetical protein G6F57_010553 [Rhizopus arrhizus]|uniref:Uncharacterized protein n=1 Tax=Rhizopus oryzae TaxID=64495 RepID=A0A9P6X1G1_RHIOR|nr:hypothetical protein G6F24_010451 [Rhizopus arrhizus]KAG0783442.1 hypothetical protein G6F21_010532 [Rhizopus arrhizus]KAG0795964.1 hypothetical protein G6F22_005006 [Rhizopus arrhizus]KAG0824275.1 hypothetical protein G6F18_010955 [Rhizopus arrhizus]KAG0849262.1 hypothetical protein G6F17_010928 [Rhizopus arrhizus]